ncbi:hypothetical protein TNCV_138461 [Trichonephila clavipes]|nr:hypothetical protein TNCV_138461 [Trichonephila clavipes]
MSRFGGLSDRDLQCLRPEASLVLIYRPNVAEMKGRVDLAQPVNRTPDLCRSSSSRSFHKMVDSWKVDHSNLPALGISRFLEKLCPLCGNIPRDWNSGPLSQSRSQKYKNVKLKIVIWEF